MSYSDISYLKVISTDKDTHFTGGLNQYATEDETLTTLAASKVIIHKIVCESDQQLIWRLWFARSSAFDTTDLDTDKLDNYVEFDMVADGELYGNANQYRLTKNIHPPYNYISDTEGSIFLSLENMSATAKNAGATGEIVFHIYYEVGMRGT